MFEIFDWFLSKKAWKQNAAEERSVTVHTIVFFTHQIWSADIFYRYIQYIFELRDFFFNIGNLVKGLCLYQVAKTGLSFLLVHTKVYPKYFSKYRIGFGKKALYYRVDVGYCRLSSPLAVSWQSRRWQMAAFTKCARPETVTKWKVSERRALQVVPLSLSTRLLALVSPFPYYFIYFLSHHRGQIFGKTLLRDSPSLGLCIAWRWQQQLIAAMPPPWIE